MKTLIFETNSLIRHQILNQLKKLENEIIETTNLENFLNELQSGHQFGLVVVDWVMVSMDALKFISQIRNLKNTHPLYVIALTTENQKTDMLTEFQSIVDDYLVKPFTPVELKVRLAMMNRFWGLQQKLDASELQKAQHKEAQHVLDDTQKALSDAAFEALFLSKNGIGLSQNLTAEKMFGYSIEEAIGLPGTNWLAPSERENALKRVLQGDERPYESIGLHKNGRTFPIEIQGRMIDYKGEKYRITAMRDISERKKTENKLLASERRFKTLIEEVSEIAIQGYDQDRKVIFWNYASERLYGYSKNDALGKKLEDLIVPEYKREEVVNLFSKWIEDGEKWPPGEINLIDAKGQDVHVYSSRVFLDTPLGKEIFCLQVDLSPIKKAEEERKRLERQLIQKQKVESLGVMAGGIAHDFNNILAIILSNIELLEFSLVSKPATLEPLDHIKRTISRASETVRQILTFSMLTDEKPVPVKLVPVIEESLKLLRSSIPAPIDIIKKFDSRCRDFSVFAIPSQIEQVLINLCNNAVFAMAGQGLLEVEIDSVVFKKNDLPVHADALPGHYLALKVTDTGKGISEDILTKIFDPFFSTKPAHEGSGLGLSIVHGIVKKNSGFITVNSTAGQGSAFKVFFPVADTAEAESSDSSLSNISDQKRILIVDDEETFVYAISIMLRHHDFTVAAESNSRNALTLFQGSPEKFDLVITDQYMPGLSGTKLISEMRKIKPNLKSIICTGHKIDIGQAEIENLGIQEVILKPVSIRQLVDIIRNIIGEN